MKRFECRGLWWLPSSKRRITGTLSFDGRSRPKLSLVGTLRLPPSESARYDELPVVLGMTAEGRAVTLCNCVEENSNATWPSGMRTTDYRARMAVIGHHFRSLAQVRFTSVAVRFSNLTEWTSLSGLKDEWEKEADGRFRKLTVTYSSPPTYEVSLNEARIRFFHTWRSGGRSVGRFNFRQRTFIEVTPPSALDYDEYWLRYFYHIRNFLTLGLDAPAGVVQVQGFVATGRRRGRNAASQQATRQLDIYYNGGTKTEKGRRPKSRNMLFSLATVGTRYGQFLERWIARADTLGPVFNLYFGTIFNPENYLELQFLSLAQAVESYHRRTIGGQYLGPALFAKVKEALIEALRDQRLEIPRNVRTAYEMRLGYFDEYSLRKRLKELITRIGPLAAFLIHDSDAFVNSVVSTRNYLTHYDKTLRDSSASGLGLYHLGQQLRFLLELCLLREVGFEDAEIRGIVERHPRYLHLRSQGLKGES